MGPIVRRAFLAAGLALVLLSSTPARAAGLSVVFTRPAAGSVVAGIVELGAATGPSATSVRFDWSVDPGSTWTEVGTDVDPADGWSVSWDTTGYDGPARLRATAADGTSQAVAFEDVTVDNRGPVLSLAVAPTPFSPNGDGAKDQTVLTLSLEEAVTLDVAVEDAESDQVRKLLDASPAGPGDLDVPWKGSDDGGAPVQDGRYVFHVVATDGVGNATDAVADVLVDTRAPTFAWRNVAPEPLLGDGPVRLTFRTWDRARTLGVTLAVFDASGLLVERVSGISRERGLRTVPWDATYPSGASVLPGLYRARLTVSDDAGNRRSSHLLPFRDHRPGHAGVFRRLDGSGRRVALTFDDCTFGDAWKRILNILRARDLLASFFCSGEELDNAPGLARRTVRAGHTIGSHGWDHAILTQVGYDGVRSRLAREQQAWWRLASGAPVPYLRPPYGLYDPTVLGAAGDAGYRRVVIWDVDPRDWQRPGASTISDRVLDAVRPGSIVILHTLPETARALPSILDGLEERGLREVSLARLFRAAGMR